MKTLDDEVMVQEENEDIIKLWEPLEFNIDENYKYIEDGNIFSFFSNLLYYGIAFPVLKILTKIVYDLKIEGKENIRNLKQGAITVSNHILILDCAMVGLACGFKKVYYTTREGSFKIPFVRKLIKLLRAIPIPTAISNKKNFAKSIGKILKAGNVVHFYPEASLWPYYEKLRNFKYGAFNFAVENDVPIVPIVLKLREPEGIRKFIKNKKDVTLVILEPIMPEDDNLDKKERASNLKEKVHREMEEALK